MARSVGQKAKIVNRSSYIPTTSAALCAMAMVCEKGPVGEARRVDSWPEFVRTYGNPISGYIGAREARRALDGGCALLVSRVVHYSDLGDASTKTSVAASVTVPDRSTTPGHGRSTASAVFPFALAHGDTIVVEIDGGGDDTATFNAYARRLTGSGGTHASVTAGHSLVLVVAGVLRSVAFSGSEASAADFAAAINASIAGVMVDVSGGNLRITTDVKGSDAALSVHSTTSSDVLASLGFTSGQASLSLGSSNVANIDAVTAEEFTAIVEAAASGATAGADADGHPYIESDTTGSGSTVEVKSSSTAEVKIGFDTTEHAGAAESSVDALTFTARDDGTHAHALRLVIDDATGDQATRFRVRETDASGVVLKTHDNLSMDSDDPRYVVTVFSEESENFDVTDEESATAAPGNRPLAGTYTPAGGDDGLTSLSDDDYVGDAATHTGLHAFDNEADFRLAAMVGVTSHTGHVAGVAWAAALTEVRYVGVIPFAITTKTGALAFRRRTSPYATGSAIDSEYGALYAGWNKVRDPRTREQVWLSGIGEVFAAVGACAKESGVWLAPAGLKRAKLGPEVLELRIDMSADEAEALRDGGCNPFYQEPSGPMYIEGSTTLTRTPSQMDRLGACMLVDYVSEQVRNYNRIDRHDPNDTDLWRNISERTDAFLKRLGARRGTFEKDARGVPRARVIVDGTNNTPETVAAHQTMIAVGVVPVGVSEEQVIEIDVFASGTAL